MKGTKLAVVEHLKTCPFEVMREFILMNDSKMETLQATIEAQATEIRDLRQRLAAVGFRVFINANSHSKDGILLSGGYDGSIKVNLCDICSHLTISKIFNAETGRMTKNIQGHVLKSIWNLDNLECMATLQGHQDGINSIILLGDSKLASTSSDRTIKIWDIATQSLLHTIEDCSSEVLDATSSPDMLFASCFDASIAVFDLNTFTKRHTMRGHNWEVWKVGYSDGVLFTGSFDHTIKRWDPRTFTETCTLIGHKTPTCINQLAIGNFSGTRAQEIIVARSSVLELLKVDSATGKIHTILSHDVFGVIRCITPFRLTGASKGTSTLTLTPLDYVVVGSDSGRIVILEYNPAKNLFNRVHMETYGKTGCRRIVPGQYLAADPKGRAVMIGKESFEPVRLALTRELQVRNSAAELTISSPLEAHKAHTICFYLVGVDVGYENPIFAAIEVDYSDADQDPSGKAFQNLEKVLTYYELDLGLNHVVRKWSEPVDSKANMLIHVPGGTEGPSGVLVCSENYITWMHQDCTPCRVPIPRRLDPLQPTPTEDGDATEWARSVIVVSGVVHKLKKGFFILCQTEEGDMFKVTMDYETGADGVNSPVQNLKIKYFDSIPVAGGMVLMKTGLLFVASEFGNHLGDDDEDQVEYESSIIPQDHDTIVPFQPRGLRNLTVVDEMDSLSPLIDAKVLNLTEEDTPQIFAVCGRGARSSFRILRHGLEATEIAVSELPGNPSAVWTVKASAKDEHDSFIIVSFVNATLVLSIGETVEERTDTGFLDSTPTLMVGQLGDDALVQVYPKGIRHIRADKRVSEWKASGNKTVVKAACNQRQVIIALSSFELVYFELDGTGQLNEYQDRKELGVPVTSLSMGKVPEGRQRSKFLAVGCYDSTVRIISLDPDNCLGSLAVQALSAPPESLAIIEMFDTGTAVGSTYLNIGLQNGVMLRTTLDSVTGSITDSRQRFLGSKPVKLFEVSLQGQPALLALSTRPWLSFVYQSRTKLMPLSYEMLEYGSSFSSEQCPEGMVAIAGNTLRIMVVERLGAVFNQHVVPLKYTPRRFVLLPHHNNFVIIETDHNTWSPAIKAQKLAANQNDMDENAEDPEELPPEQFGLPKAEPGQWASCVRVLNPLTAETLSVIDLDNNEAAFCVQVVTFPTTFPGETFVIVGGGQNTVLAPKSCAKGILKTYKVVGNGTALEYLHTTDLEEVPNALCPFHGRLLVGMGKSLRIYEMGKKKLLRKCEARTFPNCIVGIHTQGHRIVIADIQESIHYAIYIHQDNRIFIFADDTACRWITASVMTDYDTIAGGDKFGNIFVNRLPQDISEEVDEDPTGNKLVYEKGYLHGAPHKIPHLCEFHVGETITAIQKAGLVPGGREVLIYTTILGRVGVLVPFISKDDVDFFQTLEMHMRQEAGPLCGRDHLTYRGAYVPVKNVIDGDICEFFNLIPVEKRRAIAEELDRSVAEVAKKMEDLRNRSAF
ncbi:Splicing factor 3B subunit 3 [Irineochytrium annulatum]|nr:Splicing factor 3B subunit 3 [Irineochytrium annulatum]